MRKFIIVMLLLMTTGASYGAVSEDMNVYVRKDVFEVYMQNINAKFDMIMEELKEQKRMIADLSDRVANLSERVANLSGRVDGLDKRMDSLDKRIDDLRNGIYLWLVAIGLVVSWPKLKETVRKWANSTPSITLEDVKRLIEENNARTSGKVQA
ncbi:MAG: hypothetical protein IJR98_01785 [Synergistaceae bacterium]|nr:hypothetical protein [Synergistaceae bacterium]